MWFDTVLTTGMGSFCLAWQYPPVLAEILPSRIRLQGWAKRKCPLCPNRVITCSAATSVPLECSRWYSISQITMAILKMPLRDPGPDAGCSSAKKDSEATVRNISQSSVVSTMLGEVGEVMYKT